MSAGGPSLVVVGGRELRAALKAANPELLERMKAAHRAAADIVAARSRELVPVRTGRLQASIRPGATKLAALVRAGSARVPYAQPIHWGWHRRHIAASLFLSHAAQQTEPSWLEQYHREVLAVLDSIPEGPHSP